MAPRTAFAPEAAAVRPRRARRVVGLGALPRLLRSPWLGRSRAQPSQSLLVADRRPDDPLVRHLYGRCRRRPAALPRRGRPHRAWDGWPARAQGRGTDATVGPRPSERRAAPGPARPGPGARAARDP